MSTKLVFWCTLTENCLADIEYYCQQSWFVVCTLFSTFICRCHQSWFVVCTLTENCLAVHDLFIYFIYVVYAHWQNCCIHINKVGLLKLDIFVYVLFNYQWVHDIVHDIYLFMNVFCSWYIFTNRELFSMFIYNVFILLKIESQINMQLGLLKFEENFQDGLQ